MNSQISHEDLLSNFRYDHETGRMWRWRRKRKDWREVGSETKHGYIALSFEGVGYRLHRLAWFYAFGTWPQDQLDHINGVRNDNRLSNLREVSQRENSRNSQRSSANTSGVMGVTWDGEARKWRARIFIEAGCVDLGRFKEKADAIAARKEAEKKHGFHVNHGR